MRVVFDRLISESDKDIVAVSNYCQLISLLFTKYKVIDKVIKHRSGPQTFTKLSRYNTNLDKGG